MYIGIICPNYSGSTVVGSVLHRFNLVQHVGEIWKIFSDKQVEKAFCNECERGLCPYFSEEFKDELRGLDISLRVQKMKERFGVKIIVSGDKRPFYYDNYTGRPDRVLILIKNKYAAALSNANRINGFSVNLPKDKLKEIIYNAASEYFDDLVKRILWCKRHYQDKDIIYASPEIIVELSDSALRKFGRKVFSEDLVLSEKMVDEKFHYIGGNHKISKGKNPEYFNGEIKADRRYQNYFDKDLRLVVDTLINESYCLKDLVGSECEYLEDWVNK